jgi:hypothetical protein
MDCIAYAAAQSAISWHETAAVALGKDINGLIGDFSKFFHMAEQVPWVQLKRKSKV